MGAEPSPRMSQFSAVVEGKLCVYGGCTREFYKKNKKSRLASSVHSFDPVLESWSENECSGKLPLGLYSGCCAAAGHHLYTYGGCDGPQYQCSLHQLDTKSVE
jgi:N-acetylneuraminic acid mutarotase